MYECVCEGGVRECVGVRGWDRVRVGVYGEDMTLQRTYTTKPYPIICVWR